MNTQSSVWETVIRTINRGEQPTQQQWDALSPDEKDLIELLQKEKLLPGALEFIESMNDDGAWNRLSQKISVAAPVHRIHSRFFRYAAVITGILLAGAATLFFLKKNHPSTNDVTGATPTESTATKQPTLVLDDGRSIALEQRTNATIVQGPTTIRNTDSSVISYDIVTRSEQPAGFNTLIIPRGLMYTIQLADGSKVWLNAETKLRYPTHFGGVTKRTVYLESGEAYFKVKHNAALPFVVKAGSMEVQVLGTEFNVNTYTSQYATTLVTGSVQLKANDQQTLLKPGQQVLFSNGKFSGRGVDVETYTGWKEGQMIFEEARLEDVMNVVGRQYDYAIEFTSPALKDRRFGGRLMREEDINNVLSIIEKAGYMQFSIKGKTIIVSPVVSR